MTSRLVLFVFFSCIFQVENFNNSRNDALEGITQHLGLEKVGYFSQNDINTVMSELHFRKCSQNESSDSCKMCFTSDDLIKLSKVKSQENYTSQDSLLLMSGIVYLLTVDEVSVECKKFGSVLNISSVYNEFKSKYGSPNITKRSLDKILSDINITLGSYLNSSQCFKSEDVINAANVSSDNVNENGFEFVSSFIILNLLNGLCISSTSNILQQDTYQQDTSLPPSNYFIDDIFHKYGNESQMSSKSFEALLKKLNIGIGVSASTSGLTRRKKRSAEQVLQRKKRNAELSFDKCYTTEDILSVFNVFESIEKDKFQVICPALVQQIESGYCVSTQSVATEGKSSVNWKPWVVTMVAIFIINLGSFIGLIASPMNKKNWFPLVLLFIISMGVGVLVGDGILHLLPDALDIHNHGESDTSNIIFSPNSSLWKCCLILAGIYVFFAFEIIMHAFGTGHSHSHGGSSSNQVDNNHNSQGIIISNEECEKPASDISCNVEILSQEKTSNQLSTNTNKVNVAIKEINSSFKISKKSIPIREFKSVVWMIFVGDGIHNFMDGVALGAAYSDPAGINGGISTSIAILLHELPHELSDFAILITAGLSIKQALIMHFISSITAFAGGCLGVSLGTEWNASPWIFSVTAGLFLYVALVDMLPQVLQNDLMKTRPCSATILGLLGMLLGFGIMFCLAAYEEKIMESF